MSNIFFKLLDISQARDYPDYYLKFISKNTRIKLLLWKSATKNLSTVPPVKLKT